MEYMKMGDKWRVNVAFIGPKHLLCAFLGATHSSQVTQGTPPQQRRQAEPALSLSLSSCDVLDRVSSFFWSKRADRGGVRIKGVCAVAQQTSHEGTLGGCLLPPYSG